MNKFNAFKFCEHFRVVGRAWRVLRRPKRQLGSSGKHFPQRYWVSGARAPSRPRELRLQSLGSPPRPEWTVRALPSRRPGLARYRLRCRDGPAAGTREGQAGGGRWVRPVAGGLTAGRHRNGPMGRSSAQPRFF
ncbi:Interleukin-12 Receptor Subunit Beta-2 [Manis pentadactyla]|nr:Interleukin-12 Receptor Subunit Beta-2 [Manis pentadactyla]